MIDFLCLFLQIYYKLLNSIAFLLLLNTTEMPQNLNRLLVAESKFLKE